MAKMGEHSISGIQKAAILLIALGPEKSSLIFKHLKEDDLLRCLKMYDFSEEDIVFLLEESITQDYSYQLPYLIAVELYVIYHNNRKKALAVLEDIILNGDQYNIFDILNKYGIVLNKNVLYYEDFLYKKITL